jgi:hypothetical protein
MKKIMLVCAAMFTLAAMTACKSGMSVTAAIVDAKPISITSVSQGMFPVYPQLNDKWDSLMYGSFSIDTNTLFHRCVSDTTLVGFVLVPTGFDTLAYQMWVSDCGFAKFKREITIEEVQSAENLLTVCVNKKDLDLRFHNIKKRYNEYGRQYLFFYNKEGNLCVKVNCSCKKYDWLFSRRYTSVCDGGDCFWEMTINIDKREIIRYSINGYA